MNHVRIAIAAALGVASCVVVTVACVNRASGPRSQGLNLVKRSPLETTLASINQVIERAKGDFGKPARTVVEDAALLRDVRETLVGLSSDDPSGYLAFREQAGFVFNRKGARELAELWYDHRITDVKPPQGVGDGELLKFLWSTAGKRFMKIQAVLPAESTAGRGTVIGTGDTDLWPYTNAARFCSCLFHLPSGFFQRSDGESLDGTEKSAHVTVGVVFEGGIVGHLRFNYFFDDTAQKWVPVTIAAGSQATDYWPWPVF